MSSIMFAATVALTVSGVCFAGLYLWINLFSSLTDLADRSRNAYGISRISIILSLVFALLSSIITDSGSATEAIATSRTLFGIIAIAYLVITVVCGAAMIYAVLSRRAYRRGIGSVVGRMFLIAIIGAVIGLVFSWLLG